MKEDDYSTRTLFIKIFTIFVGARKIKRARAFSDGLNATKALLTKRKNRVKKYFGRVKRKKISLANFMEYIQTQLHPTDVPKTVLESTAEVENIAA